MINTSITGPAVRGLSRREITNFVTRCVRSAEHSSLATRRVAAVSIAFIDDARMSRLNRRYRGKRRTTDILTFPADDPFPGPEEPVSLGEIVISLPQARRQAAEQRHSLATEVRYLLLHGLLHAYGYDHEADRGEMNAAELQLRRKVGLE